MAEAPELEEGLKQMLGRQSEPVIYEVERGAIRRYAIAIDDSNPLYRDVEYARQSRYGEVICPPGFFGWPLSESRAMSEWWREEMERSGLPRLLDAGGEYEFIRPIRAGDTLTAVEKIIGLRYMMGRSGKMLHETVEVTYVNQYGQVVAKSRRTAIMR